VPVIRWPVVTQLFGHQMSSPDLRISSPQVHIDHGEAPRHAYSWKLKNGGTDLCACLLSSCRRVKAGLLSGFGPLRLGGWPSMK
jgi:hypothetical protein